MSTRKIGIGFASLAMAALVVGAPQVSSASDVTNGGGQGVVGTVSSSTGVAAAVDFPSADSTVVGSTGFVDGEMVGYFWSAARGDSVSETLAGPAKIKKAILKVDVPYNGLASGAFTDWDVVINGKVVGDFTIAAGEAGPVNESYKFKRIKGGGEYDVQIVMTNEVASGAGAITLRYAGAGEHSINLKKK